MIGVPDAENAVTKAVLLLISNTDKILQEDNPSYALLGSDEWVYADSHRWSRAMDRRPFCAEEMNDYHLNNFKLDYYGTFSAESTTIKKGKTIFGENVHFICSNDIIKKEFITYVMGDVIVLGPRQWSKNPIDIFLPFGNGFLIRKNVQDKYSNMMDIAKTFFYEANRALLNNGFVLRAFSPGFEKYPIIDGFTFGGKKDSWQSSLDEICENHIYMEETWIFVFNKIKERNKFVKLGFALEQPIWKEISVFVFKSKFKKMLHEYPYDSILRQLYESLTLTTRLSKVIDQTSYWDRYLGPSFFYTSDEKRHRYNWKYTLIILGTPIILTLLVLYYIRYME